MLDKNRWIQNRNIYYVNFTKFSILIIFHCNVIKHSSSTMCTIYLKNKINLPFAFSKENKLHFQTRIKKTRIFMLFKKKQQLFRIHKECKWMISKMMSSSLKQLSRCLVDAVFVHSGTAVQRKKIARSIKINAKQLIACEWEAFYAESCCLHLISTTNVYHLYLY